jgi:hypothetical protein
MFIVFLLFEQEIPHGEEAILRRLEPEGLILRDAAKTPLLPSERERAHPGMRSGYFFEAA